MSGIVYELAVVMLIASTLGLVARLLRQPLILAYIATGAIIAFLGAFSLIDHETFRLLSDLGIMFLLFLVGLEINYSSLRLVGKTSLIIGLGQIIFTALFGYLIARWFALAPLSAMYLALALTFSSTIIIVKLLSEKKDLSSLYGKITIGLMLVQDVCAILVLIILASVEGDGGFSWLSILFMLVKALALFGAMLWLGRKIFPRLLDRFANSQELFFLLATGWVFLIAAFVSRLGFSIEIGGFLAGVSLANSTETLALSSRIKPLRDFFILVFFALLGASLVGTSYVGLGWQITVFSLFVLIGNPLIVVILMGLLGYRRITSFSVGVAVAQVSEFSLILVSLGLKAGHVDESIVATVTAVAIVTIALSTYLVTYTHHLVRWLDPILRLFERKKIVENMIPKVGYHKKVILIGAHRTGASIVAHIPKEDLLIIDFDPDVTKSYLARGYDCLLGSIDDDDIRDLANMSEAKLIISTSPDFEDNSNLLKYTRVHAKLTKIIVRAEDEREAELLYAGGATYVIFPHLTSGHFLGKHLAEHPDLESLGYLRGKDLRAIHNL